MANRALLGQRGGDYGLWVSKPGQNVVSASPANLLFSSDYAVLTPAVTGSFTMDWQGGNEDRYRTIMLGMSFPTPPQMIFRKLNDDGQWGTVGDSNGFYFNYWENLYNSNPQRQCMVSVSTGTDRINITSYWGPTSSGNVAPPTFVIHYTAFNYNI